MRNTILIVDDSDINRGLLSSILEQDYTIVEAENGTQALEIIDRQADELTAILLDLIMPKMDGCAGSLKRKKTDGQHSGTGYQRRYFL